ncbi:hypothetical protein WH47_01683 [Habropoda laboriosa]|uniref:Uncharacterized protein n=1 Tax=Habropoda laboriosa TaxID=597456 RepID=A0A0L7QZS5_9HYME|nr:hypothetical protein WH47_01683 [Habropoda laboriosa]
MLRYFKYLISTKYPGRWIGRSGTVEWPARSPDLIPIDFYLWGTLKDIVYTNKPTTPVRACG